jgi:4-amino-4-deoxy-L-arabinose transferase-like glycosyltransferase
MKRLQTFLTLPMLSVFGLALVVRILYNSKVAGGYFPLHDSLTYQTIAYNILEGHCYCLIPSMPTVDRAPLWPAVIAALYYVLGPHENLVRHFLSVVGSGTCVLIYCFARDLFGRRIGLFAGILAAIYPFLYIYDGWLYSESLYIFLLFAFCYTLYHLQRTPHRSLMLLSGLLLGLISLTRPNGLLILGLFLFWVMVIGWARILPWRIVAQTAITVSLLTLLLTLPWTARNYLVTQSLVPVAVGDGKVLVGAYNDDTSSTDYQNGYYLGIWIVPTESVPYVANQFPEDCAGPCEVRRDNTYKYYAWQWIQNNLTKMPMMLGLHALNMWQITTQEADLPINRFAARSASHVVVDMMVIITPIVFALAALGLFVTRKRWRELLFIYFMIALTFVQCVALYGIPRFRAPIEPMLIVLAAGGVWWLVTLVSKWSKDRMVNHQS